MRAPKVQLICWFDDIGIKWFQIQIDGKDYSSPSTSQKEIRLLAEQTYHSMTAEPERRQIDSTLALVDGDDPDWIKGDYP